MILPAFGGQTRDGEDDFTHGAPELVVEVAWSSRSIDLGAKLRDYERAGTRKYVIRNLRDQRIHSFVLNGGKFEPLPPDADGIFRSRVFPGLWLDSTALFAGDNAKVIEQLQSGLSSPEHESFVADLAKKRAVIAGKL